MLGSMLDALVAGERTPQMLAGLAPGYATRPQTCALPCRGAKLVGLHLGCTWPVSATSTRC
jgi:hypothetical protein